MQAQELQDVYISDKEIWNMIYLNDDVFLAIEGTSAIHKIKEKIISNELFREYKLKETDLNIMIMSINQKLKTISKERSCNK